METFVHAVENVLEVLDSHPFFTLVLGIVLCFVGFTVLCVGLLRLYCKVTCGMCDSDQDMMGKTVLITGATAGVGKATAKELARRNARVILACRNLQKARDVALEICALTGNGNVVVRHLDLASLASVRKCAKDVLKTEEKLDVLINNAGVVDEGKRVTEDGHEYVFQCNHLGHFLLTLLLLDLLKKSAPSRIINVSSSSYTMGKLDFNDLAGKRCKHPMQFYGRSKLANILFTKELASRLENSGVTVNALNPGLVETNIIHKSFSLFYLFVKIGQKIIGKSIEEGAQTSIYLAVHPGLEKTTGKFFVDCAEKILVGYALDQKLAEDLFEVSKRLVGISDFQI